MIVSRDTWQDPRVPVNGSTAVPSEWRYNTIHWPGGNVNVNDPVGVLRAMQASWARIKGYSLGYNFAVFPDGTIYAIRGFDIRCAANGDQAVNRPGVAILLAVPDVYTKPTDAMIRGVREVIAQTRARVTQTLVINGHRDIRPEPTACPGNAIASMITAGIFEPVNVQSSTEEEEVADVFALDDNPDVLFIQTADKQVRHVTGEEGDVAEHIHGGWAGNKKVISKENLQASTIAWLEALP